MFYSVYMPSVGFRTKKSVVKRTLRAPTEAVAIEHAKAKPHFSTILRLTSSKRTSAKSRWNVDVKALLVHAHNVLANPSYGLWLTEGNARIRGMDTFGRIPLQDRVVYGMLFRTAKAEGLITPRKGIRLTARQYEFNHNIIARLRKNLQAIR